MAIQSINPTNGKVIKDYNELSLSEIDGIITKVHQDFLEHKKQTFQQRAQWMKNAANLLRENKEIFAKLMAEEMGKPITSGRAEAEKCAWVCDYYADNAEHFLQQDIVKTDASKSFVAFEPIGVVLAIMPWNFPFWQVFRFAAPALMAGNVGVLKHASNVPGCALAIEKIFQDAGFAKNVFRTLLVSSQHVENIIHHPLIKAVTLTGSTTAGSAVASAAGKAIKKTVLELGGSDAYVVLEDADLANAVEVCVTSRMVNSGQSCIAAKRFIVVDKIRKSFEKLFIERMQKEIMGDPLDEKTTVGPQARQDLRDKLDQQVQKSIAMGARCLLGGKIPAQAGAFYPPTVLTNVQKGMPAYDEELFGPVAAIIAAKNEQEAIRIANDSMYGLGSAVFTQDLKKGERIATHEIEAGSCFVNVGVRSDPRLPFGGIKHSGYGRELSSFGIREFVNIKTISIK